MLCMIYTSQFGASTKTCYYHRIEESYSYKNKTHINMARMSLEDLSVAIGMLGACSFLRQVNIFVFIMHIE